MIRHKVGKSRGVKAELRALKYRVKKEDPDWLSEAKALTEKFIKSKGYEDDKIWDRVVPIFRKLQKGKCGYCEARLSDMGGELDHYRPKRSANVWPPKNPSKKWQEHFIFIKGQIDFLDQLGDSLPGGYYALTYALQNYVLACHDCNVLLKRSYFPIAAQRHTQPDKSPRAYHQENPYLINPIGTLDEDPEDLIHFVGDVPLPKHSDTNSHAYRRALLTILFFRLGKNSALRKGRVLLICMLYKQLKKGSQDRNAAKAIAELTNDENEHTNCCRSFVRLYQSNPQMAHHIFQSAKAFWESKSL